MINSISIESKKSINVSIIIWFTMFTAQFIYLFVCFFILNEGLYKTIYSPDVLNNILFLSINIQTSIYIASILTLTGGYIYFKKAYSQLVIETEKQKFKDIEKEFKYFKSKYLTLMFICLAIFEGIVILGMIVFLTTLNISIMVNLVLIATIGFILVIPNKSKFHYRVV